MYSHQVKKLPKNTVEIIVDIPKESVKKEYDAAFLELQTDLQIQGFRKGKVPREIAEKQIKKESIYELIVKTVIPRIYGEIIKKESLKPIISPKIELVKAREGEDWQIKVTLAQKPTIDLGNYKEVLKKAKADLKKTDIWVPGAQKQKPEITEKEKAKKQQEQLNAILTSLLKEAKCEISDLVLEEELNHRLSNLLTDIQKIGLTVDSYLKSKNLSQDELRKRYRDEIKETYKLEFILAELADKENIKVENSDLEKLLASITDPKERETAKANSYFYASVLRKQKTLDYLRNL